MFLLEDTLKFPKDSFRLMVARPYELKPTFSAMRIQQWHEHWGGMVYVSFSGGLDSTVLAYIVCASYQKYGLKGKIPLVFSNTGVEYPEIVVFVPKYVSWLQGKFPDLDIELVTIRPKKFFKQICEEYGFPLISKENAAKIRKLRHGNLSNRYRNYLLHGDERGKFGVLSKKWHYLADKEVTAFDTTEVCCNILKKEPFKRYMKETGRYPFIGITQDESFRRENQYNHTGCNVYDGTTIKSQPLGFWTKQDILRFVTDHQIPICSVYGTIGRTPQGIYYLTGEQRTGCCLCAFGCHLEAEPNRLQRMSTSESKTHRQLYEWGMNKIQNHGVTYKEALRHCGIPTETWESVGQMDIWSMLTNEAKAS